jgi:hypothetical protein
MPRDQVRRPVENYVRLEPHYVLTPPSTIEFVHVDGARERLEPFDGDGFADTFAWGDASSGSNETSLALLRRVEPRFVEERNVVIAFTTEVTAYFDRERVAKITKREVVEWVFERVFYIRADAEAQRLGLRRPHERIAIPLSDWPRLKPGERFEPLVVGNWLETYREKIGAPYLGPGP